MTPDVAPWYERAMADTRILDVRTTTRTEMVDITSLVRNAIRASGVDGGIACVFCPHTTAGLTIQENTNPSVRRDLLAHLEKLVPRDGGYEHSEDNEDAHIKSSMVGASIALVVDGGKPHLGQWQAIYFCEFDGPRSRRVLVKVVG
jgi:secondary thiamine-phosphate synthase enzyme